MSVSKTETKVWLVIAISFTVILSASIVMLVWGLNRGLDMMDEGFGLLTCENPTLIPYASSFGFFLQKLPLLFSDQIISMRVYHIFMQLISSTVLFVGFTKWISYYVQPKKTRFVYASIFAATLISGCLSFSIFGMAISYSGLTSFFVCSSFGFAFLALANRSSPKSIALYLVSSGFLFGLTFFSKFSSFVAVYPLAIVLLAVNLDSHKLQRVGLLSLGVMLGAVVFFSLIEDYPSWSHTFEQMVFQVELTSKGSHGPDRLFIETGIALFRHLPEVTIGVLGFAAAFQVAVIAKKRQLRNGNYCVVFVPVVVMVGLGAYWFFQPRTRSFQNSMVYWSAISLVTSAIACGVMTGYSKAFRNTSDRFRILTSLTILAIVPFATSFGTDSPLLWHALSTFSPLVLSLSYLALFIQSELNSHYFVAVFLCVTTFFNTIQLVNGFVFRHKGFESLLTQTEPMKDISRLRSLYLDHQTASFIREANYILQTHKFQAGDEILCLYDAPGLVYALGGISPGFGWYGAESGYNTSNDYFLPRLAKDNNQRLFIVIENPERSSLLDAHAEALLKQSGIDFPADFSLIGKSFQPYLYYGKGADAYFYERRREGLGKSNNGMSQEKPAPLTFERQ